MENASKALLIAAAVLIAIILIAVGIKIFNSTSDVPKQSQNIGKSIHENTEKAMGLLSFGGQNDYSADEFNDEVYRILNISKPTFRDISGYREAEINVDRNTSSAINDLIKLKKLCKQRGREIKIYLTGEAGNSIDECISILNSNIYQKGEGALKKFVTKLDTLRASLEDGYICQIVYLVEVKIRG